jgi:hypothetical protein
MMRNFSGSPFWCNVVVLKSTQKRVRASKEEEAGQAELGVRVRRIVKNGVFGLGEDGVMV